MVSTVRSCYRLISILVTLTRTPSRLTTRTVTNPQRLARFEQKFGNAPMSAMSAYSFNLSREKWMKRYLVLSGDDHDGMK